MSPITTLFVEEVGGSCIAELSKWAEAAQMGWVACACLQLSSYCQYIPWEGFSPVSTKTTQALETWALCSCSATSVQQGEAKPVFSS